MAYKIDKNRLIAKFLLDNTDTIELFETFYGHINMYQQYGLDMNDSKKTLITAIHRLQSGCTFVEKDCLRRWKLMILYDRTAYDEWVKQTEEHAHDLFVMKTLFSAYNENVEFE